MSENSIEDDLRDILVALRDIDGVKISITRSNGNKDYDVEHFNAGDICAGANKLSEIWRRAIASQENPTSRTFKEAVAMEKARQEGYGRKPQPCLDPDKMHGAADGFGGSDYEEDR